MWSTIFGFEGVCSVWRDGSWTCLRMREVRCQSDNWWTQIAGWWGEVHHLWLSCSQEDKASSR